MGSKLEIKAYQWQRWVQTSESNLLISLVFTTEYSAFLMLHTECSSFYFSQKYSSAFYCFPLVVHTIPFSSYPSLLHLNCFSLEKNMQWCQCPLTAIFWFPLSFSLALLPASVKALAALYKARRFWNFWSYVEDRKANPVLLFCHGVSSLSALTLVVSAWTAWCSSCTREIIACHGQVFKVAPDRRHIFMCSEHLFPYVNKLNHKRV